MLKIETERLLIRDHQAEDLANYQRWITDPATMAFVSFGANSAEEAIILFADALHDIDSPERDKYFLAVTLKKCSTYIGCCGITVHERRAHGGIGEIGYFLFPEYTGQGYATEAACAMLDYGFCNLGFHRMIACCDAENNASEKVMQRCGMEKEALAHKIRYTGGQWRDGLQYALIRE